MGREQEQRERIKKILVMDSEFGKGAKSFTGDDCHKQKQVQGNHIICVSVSEVQWQQKSTE